VCPSGSARQTPVWSLKTLLSAKMLAVSMGSAEREGFSNEFKDPSALASLPGWFCWRIYALINPTLPFSLTCAIKS